MSAGMAPETVDFIARESMLCLLIILLDGFVRFGGYWCGDVGGGGAGVGMPGAYAPISA